MLNVLLCMLLFNNCKMENFEGFSDGLNIDMGPSEFLNGFEVYFYKNLNTARRELETNPNSVAEFLVKINLRLVKSFEKLCDEISSTESQLDEIEKNKEPADSGFFEISMQEVNLMLHLEDLLKEKCRYINSFNLSYEICNLPEVTSCESV